jgi:hypothetical protein
MSRGRSTDDSHEPAKPGGKLGDFGEMANFLEFLRAANLEGIPVGAGFWREIRTRPACRLFVLEYIG